MLFSSTSKPHAGTFKYWYLDDIFTALTIRDLGKMFCFNFLLGRETHNVRTQQNAKKDSQKTLNRTNA
jgi:hypothetical protein